MAKMMTPRDKVGRVVFLSELMSDARDLSSCCLGVEARLDRLANSANQREIYAQRRRGFSTGFSKLIKAG
jgi:hypothetical protein